RVSVPPLTEMAASLVTFCTADEPVEYVMVAPLKAASMTASSLGPGSTSPVQFTGSVHSVPVPVGPPSKAMTAGAERSSSRNRFKGKRSRRVRARLVGTRGDMGGLLGRWGL